MDLRAMGGDFEEFELVHEIRRSSQEAYVLARSSLYASLGRHVWFFQPPDDVCTPSVLKNLTFWTMTRSPKHNFDLLLL
jgi:hypothetical protein